MPASTLEPSHLGILLVDVQPLFWDQMHGPREPVMARIEHLLLLAGCFDLPLVATFEHPTERKGWLPERLEAAFPAHGQRLVKRTFDCCSENTVREALARLGREQLAVAGAETDVCILQSVLGLLRMGYQVFLLEDCLFTSEPHPGPAIDRLVQAGAIPCTYKSLYYELTQTVERSAWPAGWQARLEAAGRLGPPEALPPWERAW